MTSESPPVDFGDLCIPKRRVRTVDAMERMWRSLAGYPRKHPWLFGIGVFYVLSFLLNFWFFSCGDPPPMLVRIGQ